MVKKLLAAVAAVVALSLAWLFFVWPPPSWYRSHWPSRTAFMDIRRRQFAAKGKPQPLRYQPVELDSMVHWLQTAAVTAEDGAFYQHHGVDWRQVGEALGYRKNELDQRELTRALGNAWNRRDRLRGASTITQQLARNLYLSPSRNPLRKLKEAAIAYRLEWALPKDRILALYLNVVELGPNVWGVEAASRRYFGAGAGGLTLDEASELIATLPHPLTSNPEYRPGRTLARADLIARKLRGENVEVPVEEPVDTLPLVLPPLPTAPPLPPLPTIPVPTLPPDTAKISPPA